jgi:hypothetical protein
MLLPGITVWRNSPAAPGGSAAAAGDIADFFTQGDQIYEDASRAVTRRRRQQALIEAYISKVPQRHCKTVRRKADPTPEETLASDQEPLQAKA